MTYEGLIESLINDGYLKTPAIIEAFRQIDRVNFVADEFKSEAYSNIPLPIGFGQTISQPLTVAFMIELLQPRSMEKVLEIGAGSGWQTSILAEIVGKQKVIIDDQGNETGMENMGKVEAIEIIPELKEFAEKNISKYSFIEKKIVSVILGNGFKGHKEGAPYDRIIAAAAASGEIPVFWKRQLKIGGRIVAPVGNNIVVIDKTSKNKYIKKEYFGFSFVPLISG